MQWLLVFSTGVARTSLSVVSATHCISIKRFFSPRILLILCELDFWIPISWLIRPKYEFWGNFAWLSRSKKHDCPIVNLDWREYSVFWNRSLSLNGKRFWFAMQNESSQPIEGQLPEILLVENALRILLRLPDSIIVVGCIRWPNLLHSDQSQNGWDMRCPCGTQKVSSIQMSDFASC